MSLELKVKAKTLQSEARIIRKEEKKQISYSRYLRSTNHDHQLPHIRFELLREHRLGLRHPARCTGLARAFIKGNTYAQTEQPSRKSIDLGHVREVRRLVNKYHSAEVDAVTIAKWLDFKLPR